MTEKWIATIQGWIKDDKNYSAHDMKRRFYDIAADYARSLSPVCRRSRSAWWAKFMSNIRRWAITIWKNSLKVRTARSTCPADGFVEYCVANYRLDIDLYGGNKLVAGGADFFLSWLDSIGCASYDAMRKYGFYAPGSFRELMKKPEGIISLGAKMGEGWLLTAR